MQVDTAVDIVDKMCEAGFTLSTQVLQSILHICEETYDYILVRYIFHAIAPVFLCVHDNPSHLFAIRITYIINCLKYNIQQFL